MTMEEFYRGCDLLEKDGYCIGCYRYNSCASYYEKETGEKVEDGYNPIPFSPWHTGTPTEEGWYLLAFIEDGRRIYDANRLKNGIWEYCLIGDILKWQKIEENEDGHTD